MIDPAIERNLKRRGFSRIAGVDEVGRGPLAGPVVAAALILPARFDAEGITDSKALTPARRRNLAARILSVAEVAIVALPAPEIDRLNIHHATLEAMRRAISALPRLPDHALIDGKFVPAGLPCPAEALVKGDSRALSIAAASIVAKVTRDAMMEEAERLYPGYSFDRNAGYPAPAHLAALKKLGLSPLHRRSFAPCRAVFDA